MRLLWSAVLNLLLLSCKVMSTPERAATQGLGSQDRSVERQVSCQLRPVGQEGLHDLFAHGSLLRIGRQNGVDFGRLNQAPIICCQKDGPAQKEWASDRCSANTEK